MSEQFKHLLKLFIISYPLLVITDLTWSGFIMKSWYQEQIKAVCTIPDNTLNIRWTAGLVAWSCIVLGALLFVLPHIAAGTYSNAFVWGGLLGFP